MATSPAAPSLPQHLAALLANMTLEEKVGQMTQPEKNSLRPADVTRSFIGSVLSGGGGYPTPNTPAEWHSMVTGFQTAALATRLRIPLLYGVDAVHGHNNVKGAAIFPHNIGLGATRDAGLVQRIGRATAVEVAATSVHWNFAPAVTVPQDIRWGRTYEGYSEDPALVAELGAAFVRGLETDNLAAPTAVLACVKHYVGDGGTTWGSVGRFGGTTEELWGEPDRKIGIDQGVTDADETTLRVIHLPPYAAAIKAGARSVMASFSSWRNIKMHAHHYLLTDVLKGELGLGGFIVSDWQAINQIDPDYYTCVVTSINAGIDMVMVPFDYHLFIATLTDAVEKGYVPMARIDEAVSRILLVKSELGLFEQPVVEPNRLDVIGCAEHRALAREAVQKSAVLLKNDGALPLAKNTPRVLVAGQGADDLGLQCGGWTIEWMGQTGPLTTGTTLLEALRGTLTGEVAYAADGEFDADGDVGVVVVAEPPYAEGVGDRGNLALRPAEVELIRRVRARCQKLVLVIYAGRPQILSEVLDDCDAVVAAWLPGSEGQGLADLLCGDAPFTGKLSFAWPASMAQVPRAALLASSEPPQWPLGFGLGG